MYTIKTSSLVSPSHESFRLIASTIINARERWYNYGRGVSWNLYQLYNFWIIRVHVHVNLLCWKEELFEKILASVRSCHLGGVYTHQVWKYRSVKFLRYSGVTRTHSHKRGESTRYMEKKYLYDCFVSFNHRSFYHAWTPWRTTILLHWLYTRHFLKAS